MEKKLEEKENAQKELKVERKKTDKLTRELEATMKECVREKTKAKEMIDRLKNEIERKKI